MHSRADADGPRGGLSTPRNARPLRRRRLQRTTVLAWWNRSAAA